MPIYARASEYLRSVTDVTLLSYILFFFSSRRRHTRLQGDWSSDVCSSDLRPGDRDAPSPATGRAGTRHAGVLPDSLPDGRVHLPGAVSRASRAGHHPGAELRSEERRVGKECRSRWSPYH